MSDGGETIDAAGWRLAVDRDAEEIRLEHAESGSEYVLDADGGLRVPGDGEVGDDLGALRETLAAALDGPSPRAVADGGQAAGNCTVECDESTGEVTIESDTRIRMAAPVIDIESTGNATVSTDGVLTLEGALVRLN
ncbi:hypothetical protein [Natronomonas marina]|uniref:hypothetical protein n=1 Tax=Natronomonas marina TaxID=2961939 RepID=UPI0020CA0C37|nr:hypothetical protein [Natronomonas marina]